MNDILTAAEIEALVAKYPTIYVEHTRACWQWHPQCALALLAVSHLALWRELQAIRDTVGDENFYLRQENARLREWWKP